MEKVESYQVNNSDFILYKKDGNIQNGGFSLKKKETNESLFTIPSGLFHVPQKYTKRKDNEEEERKEIPDDLYEKLIELASVDEKEKMKGKTQRKKHRGKNNIKTRKHNKDKTTK
jgi:hypothetical protein